MTAERSLAHYLTHNSAVATGLYAALVVALLIAAGTAASDLYERHVAVAAAADLLDQIEGRRNGRQDGTSNTTSAPAGSAFVEGPTVTVAGAAMLQRVADAIRKVGGNILSSQVELEGNQSKDGLVGVVMSCEIGQPELQQLLYDLEAGMPFLFVDQLIVQAPTGFTGTEGGRLRVLLGVSANGKPTSRRQDGSSASLDSEKPCGEH